MSQPGTTTLQPSRDDPDRPSREPGLYSVLLTTEGTYPFHGGGVSTWCDVLLQGLPEVDFHLLAVMMNPFLRQRYAIPDNVVELIRAPLWGVEEPMEFSTSVPFSEIYLAKRETTERVIETQFVPIFRRFLSEVQQDGDPTTVGLLLYHMHNYLQRFDFNLTFRSRLVWDAFCEEMIKPSRASAEHLYEEMDELGIEHNALDPVYFTPPSVLEATDGLRWIYRFLTVLNHPVPRVDVSHSAAAAFCSIPCIIAKQAYGAPFLLTEHGVYLREQYLSVGRSKYTYHSKRFLMQVIRMVSRCAYRWADIVSPVCRWNSRWEYRFGVGPEKLKVIYNGVDEIRFSPMPEIERESRPTVVTMALIFPLKDIATLLRAANIVRQAIPDVLFEVYGNVSDETYYEGCLKLREKLHLEGNFEFRGRTSHPEQAYNRGDVIALSSLSEAFPFSVVEAMMCGRPVVSTDVGGVSEALGDTGIVVPARDPGALAEGILSLLQDPERRKSMGEAARERALQRFTIDLFVTEYRNAYRSLIGSQRRRISEFAA